MLITDKKVKRKLSLGTQIIVFSSVFFMALPWLGYRYMDEMKEFLVKGQGDAQLLAARALATVLHNRSDLFNLDKNQTNNLIEENSLYVYPLKHKLSIDGYGSDWNETLAQAKTFNEHRLIDESTASTSLPLAFKLVLAEHSKYLYGFLSVNDTHVIYRHPGYARLDSSDQVRIALIDKNGDTRRYVLLVEAPGNVSVYAMQENWAYPLTGKPEYALNAVWKDTSKGYDVEFRLPKAWLSNDQYLMLSVVDVNSDAQRKIESVVTTLPVNDSGTLNKLIIRSPELDRIITGLGYADSNVCIVDRFRRVRAVLGSNALESKLCSLTDKVAPDLVAKALLGQSNVHRSAYDNMNDDNEVLIIASHPVYQDKDIIGAVLIEKNSKNILDRQRTSLNNIIIATAIAFIVALAGLLLFSSLLAYRIRKLQREVSTAIDTDGRLIKDEIAASRNAGDEVGELSRVFSTLLAQLKSYTGFLENIPRTLRHEILNPLNTISMTLQKMRADKQFDQRLIDSANQATRQLELIVHSLTEAAHIEDALSQDEKETFDLAALLSEYVSNIKLKHNQKAFSYTGPASCVSIQGNDLRIIQLLDKLKDNAIDFAIENTKIQFELLIVQNNQVTLSICNKGPLIPDNMIKSLCHTILSHRQGVTNAPHLGIGLYVASRIASYHDGSLKIFNADNKDGVCVVAQFPVHTG